MSGFPCLAASGGSARRPPSAAGARSGDVSERLARTAAPFPGWAQAGSCSRGSRRAKRQVVWPQPPLGDSACRRGVVVGPDCRRGLGSGRAPSGRDRWPGAPGEGGRWRSGGGRRSPPQPSPALGRDVRFHLVRQEAGAPLRPQRPQSQGGEGLLLLPALCGSLRPCPACAARLAGWLGGWVPSPCAGKATRRRRNGIVGGLLLCAWGGGL